MTLRQLIASAPALQKLTASTKLPPRVAFRLARLMKAAQAEFEAFATQRDALLRRLGERVSTPDGDRYELQTPEARDTFAKEMESLLNEPVALPSVVLHFPEDLGQEDGLSPQEFMLLDWLIVEAPADTDDSHSPKPA
jgi:hypothetical protein